MICLPRIQHQIKAPDTPTVVGCIRNKVKPTRASHFHLSSGRAHHAAFGGKESYRECINGIPNSVQINGLGKSRRRLWVEYADARVQLLAFLQIEVGLNRVHSDIDRPSIRLEFQDAAHHLFCRTSHLGAKLVEVLYVSLRPRKTIGLLPIPAGNGTGLVCVKNHHIAITLYKELRIISMFISSKSSREIKSPK